MGTIISIVCGDTAQAVESAGADVESSPYKNKDAYDKDVGPEPYKQNPYTECGAWGTLVIFILLFTGFPIGVLVYTKTHPTDVVHENHWDYGAGSAGPEGWATYHPDNKDCALKSQSPINIPFVAAGYEPKQGWTSTNGATPEKNINDIVTPKTASYKVTQSHGAPKFSCETAGECGTLDVSGVTYNLVQFHFHSPSENTVDGREYPMTIHMVHQDPVSAKYAVVTVLFEDGILDSKADWQLSISAGSREKAVPTMTKIFRYLNHKNSLTQPIDLDKFIQPASGYFQFKGSFTTPPCTEGVDWFVQAKAMGLKASQLNSFWEHIGGYPGNARPPQPLNDRTITYHLDPK
jgi:carbonic anhydrase